MVTFLNIGVAGFVIASLGLRFTYPSNSLEGRSWWVARAAPVELETVMRQKFFFSAVPMTIIAAILGLMTNFLLDADPFTSVVSLASLLVITWTLVAMGVGFGALFPMFRVENIHQIESSLGGFVYMAASLGYIGAVVMILSWPVQMHFRNASKSRGLEFQGGGFVRGAAVGAQRRRSICSVDFGPPLIGESRRMREIILGILLLPPPPPRGWRL